MNSSHRSQGGAGRWQDKTSALSLCRCVIYPTFIFLVLISNLTFACNSYSNPEPVAAALIDSSPTPFQPENSSADSLPTIAMLPHILPTFTPYPTPLISPDILPTPAQVLSYSSRALHPIYPTVNNPLTGLPPTDPSLLDRRPIVIKVANAPDYIRPQSGLTLADVVYEYYIEWGDTRFIAVYYGNNAKMVGNVRSGRYFDEHVIRMYHAFYVFKYADPREYSYFLQSDLKDFLIVPGFGRCPPFFETKRKRENGRLIESYNSAFFNTFEWANCAARRGLDNSRQPIRNGFFSEQVPAGALSANRIYTQYSAYSYNYWEYVATSHKYVRYQEAQDAIKQQPASYALLTDALTGLPVTADNVVVIFVHHEFANSFDQEDEVYHIDLVDSGNAFVFRDGTAIPARWYRTDIDQPLLIATLNGTPVYLRPGVTFYEVIGERSSYSQDGTDWQFKFQTP